MEVSELKQSNMNTDHNWEPTYMCRISMYFKIKTIRYFDITVSAIFF